MTETADLWIDPVCPWSWLTSRWLLEVEQVRPVRANFHVMSLSVLNEGRTDITDFYRDGVQRWWGPVRVLTAAAVECGERVLRPLYTALGTRIHLHGYPYGPRLYQEALGDLELPGELADAAGSTKYDDEVRARHAAAALTDADRELGVPLLHLTGPAGTPVAHFGPVVTPTPRGKEAGRLWDAVTLAATVGGFYELKRARDVEPTFT